MSRKFTEFARFIGNYSYYRKQGITHRDAWRLAGMTLP